MMMNENEMARFVRKAIDGYFKDLDGEKARGVYDMAAMPRNRGRRTRKA